MSNFRKISKRSRIHVLFSFLLSLSDFYQCRKIGIACPMDCSKPAPPRSSRISKVSVIVGQLVRRSAGLRLRARLASPRLALTRENGASSPLVDARLQGRQAPRSHYSPSCFPPWFRGFVYVAPTPLACLPRGHPFHHGAEKCHRTRAFKSSYTLF